MRGRYQYMNGNEAYEWWFRGIFSQFVCSVRSQARSLQHLTQQHSFEASPGVRSEIFKFPFSAKAEEDCGPE